MNLYNELSRYNEYTCPDYFYEAWRTLFAGWNPPDRQEVLRRAEFDLLEDENRRSQIVFNRDRKKLPRLESAKWNWSSK